MGIYGGGRLMHFPLVTQGGSMKYICSSGVTPQPPPTPAPINNEQSLSGYTQMSINHLDLH